MLDNVNVDSGTKRSFARFFGCTLHDLFDLEICPILMFSMQKCGGDPDLVSYFDLQSRCDCHICLRSDSTVLE